MGLATTKFQRDSGLIEVSCQQKAHTAIQRIARYKPVVALAVLLALFAGLQCFIPLRTAIQIGGDEGFELAKATLCLKGYKLYTEVWNDTPPLHTFLSTQVLKHVSPSILGPRLVTSVFTAVLLSAIFFVSFRFSGLWVAALTTALLIASPGFLELASSCMVEIPGLAPAAAGLSLLLICRQSAWHIAEILAGLFFAVALQIKFIEAIYLPFAGLILCLRHRETTVSHSAARPASGTSSRGEPTVGHARSVPLLGGFGGGFKHEIAGVRTAVSISRFSERNLFWPPLFFAGSLAISFIAINLLIGEGSFRLELKQSWSSHFASTKSFEYGSPDDHPFEWSIFLKNWDATIPAILGIIVCLRQRRTTRTAMIPLTWFALDLVVFAIHKPWWSYYYIHNAIPLCWFAAIGTEAVWKEVKPWRPSALVALAVVYALCAAAWMVSRVYLQVASIRHSPQTYSSFVLTVIARFKPFTRFIYADDRIYSFHAGIPMPPKLELVSLKRLWSGDMTNEKITAELWTTKPGVILLANDTRAVPFEDLLTAEYRLVYQDDKHRLYAQKAVIAQAKW